MSEEENEAIVHEMVAMLNRADWEGLEQHPGLYETRQRMPVLRAAFPDLRFTVEVEMADGDFVALRMTGRGTHLGPVMGAASTGKEITFSVVSIDQLAGGKIMRHNANTEWLSILAPWHHSAAELDDGRWTMDDGRWTMDDGR